MAFNRRTLLLALGSSLALPSIALAQAHPHRLFADSEMRQFGRFSVEVVGTGPDLVLIPGLGSARTTWRRTAERLRGDYRLHLIQIAGFAGETSRDNANGAVILPTTEAIAGYIASETRGRASIAGHSLGGTIALRLAIAHAEVVERIIVVDSIPFPAQTFGLPEMAVTGIRAQLASGRIQPQSPEQAEAQVRSMAVSVADQDMILGWSMASDQNVVARAYLEFLTLDQTQGLAGIAAPVTVIHPDTIPGAPADLVLQNYADAFAPIPDVRMEKVNDALHFVMLDQPEAFETALDRALGQ